MSKRHNEHRLQNWKNKAISRRIESERPHKRIKELTLSRDNWKAKYKSIATQSTLPNSSTQKAKYHHYSCPLVSLVVAMYQYGQMSLRSCRHCLCCMFLHLEVCVQVPSHNNIRNWICKCGIYRVEQTQGDYHDTDYVIYVDESISFGAEKILLILGLPCTQIPLDRSVSHSDVQVLDLAVSHEWKGEQIAKRLQKINQNKAVRYVLSDEGNNLKKAYKQFNYSHIKDCTHVLAKHLKKVYQQDKAFQCFCKPIGKLRKKWNLNHQYSPYMPPSMRGKMRFANIFPCVDWAKKMLDSWQGLPQ